MNKLKVLVTGWLVATVSRPDPKPKQWQISSKHYWLIENNMKTFAFIFVVLAIAACRKFCTLTTTQEVYLITCNKN